MSPLRSVSALALVALLLTSMIFIPIWTIISKRIGKKLSYNLGMLIVALVIIVLI